jgi:hypothetical protein
MQTHRYLLATVLFLISVVSFAQGDEASAESEPRSLYLGFGTGINAYSGVMGITAEFRVAQPVSLVGALGVGSWGSKTSIGIRYYPHYPGEWSFTLGYSHCSGFADMKLKMDEDFVKDQDGTQEIEFDLRSINTVNLSATKHWMIGKRKINRIHLELGYAIPTSSERYKTSAELTDEGKVFMRMLEPGGIMIGTGITFALRP